MDDRLSFLRILLGRLFGSEESTEIDLCEAWPLKEYVDSRVIDRVGRREPGCSIPAQRFTRLEDILEACEAIGATDETLRKATAALRRDWSRIRPEVKIHLREAAANYSMTHILSGLPGLTSHEEEAMCIRWDVADSLYCDDRRKAFRQCMEFGLDVGHSRLGKPRDLRDGLKKCTSVLLGLLERKAEYDIAVVRATCGASWAEHVGRVVGRLESERNSFLDSMREALKKQVEAIWDEPFAIGSELRRNEVLLRPFIDESHDLISRCPETVALSGDVYERVLKLTGGVSMSEINVTGDGNVIGDGNTVSMRIAKCVEAELSPEVAEAFRQLTDEIRRMEGLAEEARSKALKAVREAETGRNGHEIEEGLKRARDVMEDAGKLFDSTSSWGARLFRLARLVMQHIPGEWKWLSGLE